MGKNVGGSVKGRLSVVWWGIRLCEAGELCILAGGPTEEEKQQGGEGKRERGKRRESKKTQKQKQKQRAQ